MKKTSSVTGVTELGSGWLQIGHFCKKCKNQTKNPTFQTKTPTFQSKNPTFQSKNPTFQIHTWNSSSRHPNYQTSLIVWRPTPPNFKQVWDVGACFSYIALGKQHNWPTDSQMHLAMWIKHPNSEYSTFQKPNNQKPKKPKTQQPKHETLKIPKTQQSKFLKHITILCAEYPSKSLLAGSLHS